MPLNHFAADGLSPGIPITLLVEREGAVQALASRIEEISDGRITILSPMRRLRLRPNASGTQVRVEFRNGRRTLSFSTVVTGHDAQGACEFLAMPAQLENRERRREFRLKVTLQPASLACVIPGDGETEETIEPVSASIVDLSAGGMCLVTKSRRSLDGLLRARFTIGDQGEIRTDARVVSTEEPPEGYANRQVHCEFVGIVQRDRDRIARFLVKEQLALRQSGRL
jgi:c-di-GMP-binding flagellar brake protein YcgR